MIALDHNVAIPEDNLDVVMQGLKDRLSRELFTIIGARRVAYVDYALHGNTGDLLILSGALALFRQHGIQILTYDNVYAAKIDELRKLPKDVPIICHGGGNFGDLYDVHQSFRERLATELRDRKIVVMPQSIHFSSPVAQARSAEIFQQHANFHLCVRDTESLEAGRQFTSNVYLVPDCAHMLWNELPAPPKGQGKLAFMRIDKESAGLAGAHSLDWETISDPSFYKTQHLMQKLAKRLGRKPSTFMSKLAFGVWMIEVRRTIREAYRRFSPNDEVETDRLHGMLFSLLLRKRVIFHDNAVKKLSRYRKAWLNDLPDGRLAAGE